MIAMLLSLPGYLLYMVPMAAVPYMVYRGDLSGFSLHKGGQLAVASITIFLSLALKNWVWLALISELFPSHLTASTVSGMIAALVGLAGYLVCMTGLTFLVLLITIFGCQEARGTYSRELPDRVDMIIFVVAGVVMDVFMNHSSHSTMMAILLFLASYLVRVACVAGLPYMVFKALSDAFPSLMDDECGVIVVWIAIFLPLALNNFPIFTLVSKFPSHLPSSVYEMIAALLGLTGYIACMTGLSILVLAITILVCDAALQPAPGVKPPNWVLMVILGFTATVMDMFMKNSTHSNMMVMLLFAVYLVYIICVMGLSYLVLENLVFEDITVDVLPFLLPVQLNYRKPTPIIVSGVILVLNDLHGVTGPLQKPAFISEFISIVPFSVSGTLPGYLIDILCMVALSLLVLVVAVGAVLQTWTRRPMGRPELMLTTIVGLTFVLLNLMWGTPFQKPSSGASTKATLVCLAGYLVYILCSIALSGKLCESKMDALVISLTFVLLHMFSVSDMIDALVGLVWMIAKALLTLLFLAPLLFLVCAGVYTWLSILLSSSGSSYKELTFAGIVGVSFRVMQAMLDTPTLLGTADLVIKYLTVFSDMKATILRVAESINNYQTAYTVINYLAAFVYIEITRNITSAN